MNKKDDNIFKIPELGIVTMQNIQNADIDTYEKNHRGSWNSCGWTEKIFKLEIPIQYSNLNTKLQAEINEDFEDVGADKETLNVIFEFEVDYDPTLNDYDEDDELPPIENPSPYPFLHWNDDNDNNNGFNTGGTYVDVGLEDMQPIFEVLKEKIKEQIDWYDLLINKN